jgi:hypothetical protein
MLRGSGPFKARHASMDDAGREELRLEFVGLLERHRVDGGVIQPARYLIVLGTRR